MTLFLRILLLVASALTAYWIFKRIRKMKMKMEDAIFWIVFAIILFIMGVFPQIIYWLSSKLQIMSPANLVFLIVIALLIKKIFSLSVIVSQLEDKLTVLSAEVALRSHAAKRAVNELELEHETNNHYIYKSETNARQEEV